MKGRIIVLQHRPSRAALVVDGRVEDLLLDDGNPTRTPMPGEIWAAKVERVTQGGTFVSLGAKHTGYLRDGRGLKPGQLQPVQVSSVPEAGKAIPVDRRLLFKGRTIIVTPGVPGVNVSRQIKDPEERTRLADAIGDTPEGTGVIIRSAARGIEADVIRSEYRQLSDEFQAIDVQTAGDTPLAQAQSPESYALREWTSPLPEMITVPNDLAARFEGPDSRRLFLADPDLEQILSPGEGDPFDHFGIWDEIERLKSPRADLPSGGWMAVEATRAMVTVDINTGDGFGGGDAMTANIEAARELPRQLRLRGLGGQVIVDFAPLKKMHRKKIEEELKRAFRKDPIETTLAGWTPLGNFELTRKRERRPLSELLR